MTPTLCKKSPAKPLKSYNTGLASTAERCFAGFNPWLDSGHLVEPALCQALRRGGRGLNCRNVRQVRPGEGVAPDSSARISSPYVFRRQGPKSVMCASAPWVSGGRRARSQSAVRGRMTSDSTPRALALFLRHVCRRSYRSRTSSDTRSA